MQIYNQHYRTIWLDQENPDQVCIIDQRQLPHKFIIEELKSLNDAIIAIRDMHVRGAGLIGATAGYGMYLAAINIDDDNFDDALIRAGEQLNNSRPTARNLKWAVDRIIEVSKRGQTVQEKKQLIQDEAKAIADEDAEFCRRLGQHGLEVIKELSEKKNGKPVNILTHCNAGWLAFVDYGSATAPIYAARDAGIPVHVWVDETRPWNQGAKLTAWELQQENIPNTLITDNAGGHLMQRGDVDMVIVGTDRTTYTGDVANKIGTYLKALAARDNNIPFYVALPSSTFDWEMAKGRDIPIEERAQSEVTTVGGINSKTGEQTVIELTAPGTKASNYSFDITPARLVTGLITERGITPAQTEAIAELFPEKRQD